MVAVSLAFFTRTVFATANPSVEQAKYSLTRLAHVCLSVTCVRLTQMVDGLPVATVVSNLATGETNCNKHITI